MDLKPLASEDEYSGTVNNFFNGELWTFINIVKILLFDNLKVRDHDTACYNSKSSKVYIMDWFFFRVYQTDIAHLYEAGIEDCACTIWKKFGVSIA